MREELTAQVRAAMTSAQHWARKLNQDFVGCEHLLLGILESGGSEAVRALRRDVAVDQLRAALERSLPQGTEDPVVTGDLPLSPKAQRAFHGAIVKTQGEKQSRVSTRMLLLALLEEPDTGIRDALRAEGVDLDHLQRMLMEKPALGED